MTECVDKNKLIAKNTIFLYIRMFFVLIVSLYTSRIILSTLGIEDFGIYNVVTGFVSMFGFMNATIASCIQRYYNYENGLNGISGMRQVYTMAIYIELFLSIIMLLFLEIIGLWYINNILVVPDNRIFAANVLFQLSVFQMIITILQSPFLGAIMAKEKMNYYAFVGILDVVLKLLFVFSLKYISFNNLILYGSLMAIITMIDFFLYYIFCRIKFKELRLIKGFWNRKLFKSMLSFSGWTIMGAIAMVGRTQGLNMLLNLFFGPVVNAARGIATQIQGALLGLISNISLAARPQITESYAQNNVERSYSLTLSISKISYLLLLILALPIIFNIDYICKIWLNGIVPNYTNKFAILIIIASLIDVLNTPITIIINATGRVKRYCMSTSICGLLVLPLSYILLKLDFQPTCVFVASIIISILVQIVSVVELKRLTKISIKSYLLKVVVPLTIVTSIGAFILNIVSKILVDSLLSIIISIIVSLIVVVAITYAVGLTQQEKKYVKDYATRKLY